MVWNMFETDDVEDVPSELDVVEHAVPDGRLSIHLIDLFVGETLAHCRQQLTESVFIDHTLQRNNMML